MKAYTDIKQSKKLEEILPIDSADMCFANDGTAIKIDAQPYNVRKLMWKDVQLIPCWSLAALLQVLPLGIYDEFDGCDYELEIDMINKMPRYIRLGDIYHSQFPYDFEKDTLIDNIVESIIWLNDNNYFEL